MNSLRVAVVAWILVAGSHLIESAAITLEKSSNVGANRGARPMTKSPCEGGNGGRPFDDLMDYSLGYNPVVGVHSISISYRDRVDSIQVTYKRSRLNVWGNDIYFWARRHGIPKSRPTKITFEKHEYLAKVEGQTNGKYVNQLTFTTAGSSSGKKVYGPFGKNGSTSFSFEGYVVGFYGGHGLLHLDRIGVYSIELLGRSDVFGGTGGNAFDDTSIYSPPLVGISQIQIWSGETVNAIQVKYALLGFDFLIANQHGEQGNGTLTTINFPDGEIVVAIEGRTEGGYISQLTFITRKQDGSKGKYGPFGENGKCSFSIYGKIIGLYGKSGSLIDQIGVFYIL